MIVSLVFPLVCCPVSNPAQLLTGLGEGFREHVTADSRTLSTKHVEYPKLGAFPRCGKDEIKS